MSLSWMDYNTVKSHESKEDICRGLLHKYAKHIYSEYCYMVLTETYGWNDEYERYIVRQGFRQIKFNTAVETMEFLDRAITYDEQLAR